MKTAIFCFTTKGHNLANKLNIANSSVFYKPEHLKDTVKSVFLTSETLIFIGATGIATRLIAPLIKSKDLDPAVIVIDELGRFVIPILSGHLGGGNETALKIAKNISATPVITTATDINEKIAIDVFSKKNNLYFDNFDTAKAVSAKVLDGEIGIYSDYPLKNLPNYIIENDFSKKVGVCISSDFCKKPFEKTLNLLPKNKILGVGCKKNTNFLDFEDFILKNIENINEILEIRSIDLKKDEPCIIEFSKKYKIPFKTYTKDELLSIKGKFSSSEFVKSITGVDCVCERSAVFCGEKLIKKKISDNGKTLAIALKECEFNFEY